MREIIPENNYKKNIRASIDALMDDTEDVLLMLATRLGPWLAPIGPAYFVGRAVHDHLDAYWIVAFIMAIVVEVVGIASTHTALKCWAWNAEKRKTDPGAPFWLMVGLSSVYFLATITLTILVEVASWLVTYTPAIFILLTGVAYVTIPVLMRLHRLEKGRAEPSVKTVQKSVQSPVQLNTSFDDQLNTIEQMFSADPSTGVTQLAKTLNISRNTVYKRIEHLNEQGRLSKNGVGYVVNGETK